jgi:L-seryl-tRNA(Ser) seleniumtransferase
LLAGRRELVERCRRHPLYRALRPDRTAFAVLEAVLRRRLAEGSQPLDRLWPDRREHRRRLESVLSRLPAAARAQVVAAQGFLGGGSAPERPIPGEAIGLALPGKAAERLLVRLRQGRPPEVTPVVGYLKDDRLVLDLRTVAPADDDALVAAVGEAVGETVDR